jgi:hypothetical protein
MNWPLLRLHKKTDKRVDLSGGMMENIMGEVAKDLIEINVENKSIGDLYNEFFNIMRKYGIKQNSKCENDNCVTGSNYEWTMAMTLFLDSIQSEMRMEFLLGSIVPKDLYS